MQPVLDCNQSIRMPNNKTLQKSKLPSLCPKNETDKTGIFFRLHVRKKSMKLKATKKLIMDETKKGYFLRFIDSKKSPRHRLKVTKVYTVFSIKPMPLDNKVY